MASHKPPQFKSISKHHPKSRKVSQVLSKINRNDNLLEAKKLSKRIQDQKLNFVLWFKSELNSYSSIEEVIDPEIIVQKYVHRNDEKIYSLKNKSRCSNSVKPSRLLNLELQKAREIAEMKSGTLYIPDIMTVRGRKNLSEWNGCYSSISTIKMVPFINIVRRQPKSDSIVCDQT